jgi:hypothetical protein
MFSRSVIISRSTNDTSIVFRMTIVSETTTWSITYDCNSDDSRGVIYDHNVFIIQIIQATDKGHDACKCL